MNILSLQTIADYAGGSLLQGDPCLGIHGVTTDSRAKKPSELFLALRGERFDGHQFVADSLAHGAVGAVVQRGFASASLPVNFALIEVDDTLLAYQRIATEYRRALSAKVIAITGSNGKTSTKDFTAAVMGKKFRVLKTEGNLNNHVGVPKTLLRAAASDEIIVLEMGMNHPGEIAPLAAIAKPDLGIITNIGTAHIEFMGSRAGIAQEKGSLAEAVESNGFVILPSNDDFSASIAARTQAQVLMVGAEGSALYAENVRQNLVGSHFTIVVDGERVQASLPVPGKHMVNNALLAVAAGRVYGVPLVDCVTALSEVQLTKGRMEQKNIHGFHVLDDSYNANPDSMVAALETLARMGTDYRRIAVLGRMGELGRESDAGHRRVGNAAAREKIDYIVGVGPEAEFIIQGARDAGHQQLILVADAQEAAEWLFTNGHPGDLILVKGSRSVGMENVLAALGRLLDEPLPVRLPQRRPFCLTYHDVLPVHAQPVLRALTGFRVLDVPWTGGGPHGVPDLFSIRQARDPKADLAEVWTTRAHA